jgi:hypothetical protein
MGIKLFHAAETVSDLRLLFKGTFAVFDQAGTAEETDRFQANPMEVITQKRRGKAAYQW